MTAERPEGAGRLADAGRQREIADLGLLRPGGDPVLQRLVEEAARSLGLGVGLVSVVTEGAQHFVAHHGLSGWMAAAGGTPVEWSFCAHAVQSGEPFVVPDAATHERTRDNPLVRVDGIRCYAGIPLVTSRGHVLGTLCVLGNEAREFSDADLARLRALAEQAMERIEARRGEAAGEG